MRAPTKIAVHNPALSARTSQMDQAIGHRGSRGGGRRSLRFMTVAPTITALCGSPDRCLSMVLVVALRDISYWLDHIFRIGCVRCGASAVVRPDQAKWLWTVTFLRQPSGRRLACNRRPAGRPTLSHSLIAAGLVCLEVVDPGARSGVWLALTFLKAFGRRLEEPTQEHFELGHGSCSNSLSVYPAITSRWLTSH